MLVFGELLGRLAQPGDGDDNLVGYAGIVGCGIKLDDLVNAVAVVGSVKDDAGGNLVRDDAVVFLGVQFQDVFGSGIR